MKNQSKLVRAFYIVLVPVVLVVILLNSGVLQKWLTAVTVDGEPYSAVRYDYYYYSVYLAFLDSDYEAAGFDPAVSAGSQIYDGDETWREHFCQQAEERLALTAYYNGQAQAAGYTFSQEELAPVEEKLQQIKEESARLGIQEGNYYPAYYGTGMDRDAFVRELTLEVQAQAYRQHLSEELQVSGQEIEQWLEKNPVQDYPMADLWLVELDAVPARSDGAVGQRQLDDLEARLGRLEARMEQGREGIEELCLKFSDVVWGDNGLVTVAVKEDLPLCVVCKHQRRIHHIPDGPGQDRGHHRAMAVEQVHLLLLQLPQGLRGKGIARQIAEQPPGIHAGIAGHREWKAAVVGVRMLRRHHDGPIPQLCQLLGIVHNSIGHAVDQRREGII